MIREAPFSSNLIASDGSLIPPEVMIGKSLLNYFLIATSASLSISGEWCPSRSIPFGLYFPSFSIFVLFSAEQANITGLRNFSRK
jgi:hypothetical protein